jgi:drug/metabolite transporter (DMT)-like permease
VKLDRRQAADLSLLGITVVWGSTFVLVKNALDNISPVLFLALRFTLATALLLVLFRRTLRHTWTWRGALSGAVAGIFLYSGYLLQTLGLRLTTAPRSAFLTGLTSVLVPFLGAIVYKNRPQLSEVLGVFVATAGLWLMTLEGAIGAIARGDLLTLLCAVGFAAHIVTLGHFAEGLRFEVLSVAQLGAAAVLALGSFWWAETPRVAWRPAVVWCILVSGFLSTALAFAVQAWSMQYTTANRSAVIYLLERLIAWWTSFVMVGESLSPRAAVGAALILLGVVLVELKPLRQRQHPSE